MPDLLTDARGRDIGVGLHFAFDARCRRRRRRRRHCSAVGRRLASASCAAHVERAPLGRRPGV